MLLELLNHSFDFVNAIFGFQSQHGAVSINSKGILVEASKKQQKYLETCLTKLEGNSSAFEAQMKSLQFFVVFHSNEKTQKPQFDSETINPDPFGPNSAIRSMRTTARDFGIKKNEPVYSSDGFKSFTSRNSLGLSVEQWESKESSGAQIDSEKMKLKLLVKKLENGKADYKEKLKKLYEIVVSKEKEISEMKKQEKIKKNQGPVLAKKLLQYKAVIDKANKEILKKLTKSEKATESLSERIQELKGREAARKSNKGERDDDAYRVDKGDGSRAQETPNPHDEMRRVSLSNGAIIPAPNEEKEKSEKHAEQLRKLKEQLDIASKQLEKSVEISKGFAEVKREAMETQNKLRDSERHCEVLETQLLEAKRAFEEEFLVFEAKETENKKKLNEFIKALGDFEVKLQMRTNNLNDLLGFVLQDEETKGDEEKTIKKAKEKLRKMKEESETQKKQVEEVQIQKMKMAKRNEELEKHTGELEDTRREMEARLKSLIKENGALEKRNGDLESLNRELGRKNEEYVKKNGVLGKVKEALEEKDKEKLKIESKLKKTNEKNQKNLEEMQKTKAKQDSQITKMTQELQEISNVFGVSASPNENLLELIESFKDSKEKEINELKGKLDQINQETQKKKEKEEKLKKSIEEMAQEMQEQKMAFEMKLQNAEMEANEYKKEFVRMREALSQREAEENQEGNTGERDMKKRYQEKTAGAGKGIGQNSLKELKKCKETLRKLGEMLRVSELRINQKENGGETVEALEGFMVEFGNLQRKLEEKTKENQEMGKELSEMKRSHQELKEACRVMQGENERLEESIKEFQKTQKEAKKEDFEKHQRESLIKEMEFLQKSNIVLGKSNESFGKEIKDLQRQNEELQRENEKLQGGNQELTKLHEEVQKELQFLQKEQAQVRTINALYNGEKEKYEHKVALLHEEVQHLEEQKQTIIAEWDNEKKKYVSMISQRENDTLQVQLQLEKRMSRIEELDNQLHRVETACRQMFLRLCGEGERQTNIKDLQLNEILSRMNKAIKRSKQHSQRARTESESPTAFDKRHQDLETELNTFRKANMEAEKEKAAILEKLRELEEENHCQEKMIGYLKKENLSKMTELNQAIEEMREENKELKNQVAPLLEEFEKGFKHFDFEFDFPEESGLPSPSPVVFKKYIENVPRQVAKIREKIESYRKRSNSYSPIEFPEISLCFH